MGRPIKIKGKEVPLEELEGQTFDTVKYEVDRGAHVVTFEKPGVTYSMWGQSCCCDVASIDYIDGPLSRMGGVEIKKAEVEGSGGTFALKTVDDWGYKIKWKSKHPRFTEKGVKFTKMVKPAE